MQALWRFWCALYQTNSFCVLYWKDIRDVFLCESTAKDTFKKELSQLFWSVIFSVGMISFVKQKRDTAKRSMCQKMTIGDLHG